MAGLGPELRSSQRGGRGTWAAVSGLLLPGQRPRWPQLGLQLQARLAMAVGMLVLLITAAVIAASLVAEAGDVGQLGRTRGLQVDNLQLEVAMVDQETGVRGYAATGQPVFLQPYESGRAQLGPLLRTLERESRGTRFAAAVLDV